MIDLRLGDCLEVLKQLPENSVDACVTDPPYGLRFMSKAWDYDVPSVDIWQECFRVLKPGGHLLAFAGTRTQHRMAVNIEDAGFEIRDMIAWVYGSGFPKSMDVSKAIDKTAPRRGLFDAFAQHFDDMWRISGLKRAEFVPYFPHYKNAESVMAQLSNWKLAKNVPTRQDFLILQELLGLSDEFAPLIDRIEAEREVVGKSAHRSGIANGTKGHRTVGGTIAQHVDITAPATPEAQEWEGWGTALKPALEPITVARKPFKGTVAANVLEHGTGALNVDGCRINAAGEDFSNVKGRPLMKINNRRTDDESLNGAAQQEALRKLKELGRWPANLIHDGSDEVTHLFPDSKGQQGAVTGNEPSSKTDNAFGKFADRSAFVARNDSGSAARFFYCAKASKADRGKGNTHPTVKPTELMRYLCRLVTPPGGIVLDPFMGSGSTGKAAAREGFGFIGIEREAEYLEIARNRIELPAQGSLL